MHLDILDLAVLPLDKRVWGCREFRDRLGWRLEFLLHLGVAVYHIITESSSEFGFRLCFAKRHEKKKITFWEEFLSFFARNRHTFSAPPHTLPLPSMIEDIW